MTEGGRIAVIGWGSLIWDLDDLAPKVEGEWVFGAGPVLPVEFSRVSRKRAGALTLVIDPTAGAPVRTAVIASVRNRLDRAVADLAARERAPEVRIGRVAAAPTAPTDAIAPTDAVAARVAGWCRAEGWAGAVWTDLPSNFEESEGRPFSVPAAVGYLRSLRGGTLMSAKRYIDEAPRETDTPLRRALAADPWWRGLSDEP